MVRLVVLMLFGTWGVQWIRWLVRILAGPFHGALNCKHVTTVDAAPVPVAPKQADAYATVDPWVSMLLRLFGWLCI